MLADSVASDSCELSAASNLPVPPSTAPPPAQSRKRKRAAPPHAASPAPSDPGNNVNPPDLLSARGDLSSRPQLSISRGPTFAPVADGSEYFKTDLIGVNRVGYRYVPAGIHFLGSILHCRTIESNPTTYRVSWEDRSPFITVTKDGLGLHGGTGFRSARCNAPMVEGKWYIEVKVVSGGGEHHSENGRREGSHVRVGWGRREAPLNGPVGLDGYSYGYRDKTGEKVTLSRPRPYGRTYGTGDVIGMYISLPPRREANKKDPHDPAHLKRERIPIDLKGQEVFEISEYPQSKEMTSLMDYSGKSTNSTSVPSAPKKSSGGKPERSGPSTANKPNTPLLRPLPILQGSRIAFFVNGESQGVAFQDVYDYLQLRQSETQRKKEKKRTREEMKKHRENPFNDGWLGYYPFISLFNDACVDINPGPNFDFPPPNDIDALLDGSPPATGEDDEKAQRTWRPACERYAEFMAEQWALDEVEEEEVREEAIRLESQEKVEAAKKAEREKKKQQAEARKRAKLAAAAELQYLPPRGPGTPGSVDDERLTPGLSTLTGLGQPSPLRHGMTYFEYEGHGEGSTANTYSPAPTPASNGEFQGEQSGYNSEMEVEHTEPHVEESAAVPANQSPQDTQS